MTLHYPDFRRIAIDPAVCMGKPHITGTRMPVSSILAYLAGGMSIEEFLKEFNWLKLDDVLEALAFASVLADEQVVALESVV
jgi:uncharacterized protein (DUF433 family)